MTRKFSSVSVETALQSAINSSATTMTVTAGTGTALMGGVSLAAGNVDQFTLALNPDTINEEIVYVTGISGDTLTVSRGRAGTGTAGVSGIAHSAGASIKHVLTSDDLTFYTTGVATADAAVTLTGTQTLTNKTISASSNTLTGVATLTGTETLTNKTLTSPIITTPTQRLSINAQTGTTYTLVAADASYKLVTASNAAAITVTVPPSIFTAGDVINLQQIGAGQVTFAQGAGVTITSTGATATAPKLRAQYSACSVICTASNTFTVVGDIA